MQLFETLVLLAAAWLIGFCMGLGFKSKAPQTTSPTEPNKITYPEPDIIINEPKKHTDSINTLLYFGAFLIIASVGLFVGLSDFSGSTKTTAVAFLAIAFYSAGLYLHHAVKKLRPAATAFTSIGLFSMPLAGVAAYVFATDQNYGSMIWLITSAACLVFYVIALWRLKESLIGYASVIMFLSLWLSVVSVVDAPIYYFGWTMLAMSIVFVFVTRRFKLWGEVQKPLDNSAQLLVPISIITMVLFGHSEISLLNYGISLALAASFYGLLAWLEKQKSAQLSYIVLAAVVAAVSLGLIAYDLSNESLTATAYAVDIATIFGLLILAWQRKNLGTHFESLVALMAIIMILSTLICAMDANWQQLAILLTANLLVHSIATFYTRSEMHTLAGVIVLLTLPAITGFLAVKPHISVMTVFLCYVAIAAGLLASSRIIAEFKEFKHDISAILTGGFVASIAIGWIISFFQDTDQLALCSLIVGAVLLAGVYVRKIPSLLYLLPVLTIVCLIQYLHSQNNLNVTSMTLATAFAATAFYLLGKLHKSQSLKPFARGWTFSGVALMYISAAVTLFANEKGYEPTLNAITLSLAGALTSIEIYFSKKRSLAYIGGMVIVAGVQWLMYINDVREVIVYGHMWAIFFAFLAWLSYKNKNEDQERIFTIFALSMQSVPIALQTLSGDNTWGLLLLVQNIVILLFGLWIKNPLVSRWGLAVAVGSVLYQLKDFEFFVLALLGAGVIGLSIYLLLKKK